MRIQLSFLLLMILYPVFSQDYEVFSPDGTLKVIISTANRLTYQLFIDGEEVITPSRISMTLNNGDTLGVEPRVRRNELQTHREIIKPQVWFRSEIEDHYNELTIEFRQRFTLNIRLYDDGFAYRFTTRYRDRLKVLQERQEVRFAGDPSAFVSHPYNGSMQHSYESNYTEKKLSVVSDSLIMLPAMFHTDDWKIVFTDANVISYPHTYLWHTDEDILESMYPSYPEEEAPGGHRDLNLRVTRYQDHIADVEGNRTFPWRTFIIAREDRELLTNDLVYRLSDPPEPDMDLSWVEPGLVAWDWWNAMNLSGVDFPTGVNNDTYRYFIDYAAAHGIPYVNIDEGWSELFDLMQQTEQIDIRELVEYANRKGVKIFLWCVARTLDAQLEEAMEQFVDWGVAGLKVDFMDRDDQKMVEYYYRIAESAARNRIHVNFHGAFKPTGMYRKYPNVLNHEGVRGLEYNKFADPDGTTPRYAVSIPFIRMPAGYMDYTPGAMTNANRRDFRVINDRPMSQGTRCQQLAMYVMYFAPLQMMADAPTRYQAEPDILNLLKKMPTTWDKSIPLAGQTAEFAAIARRNTDTWYVAAMTNWEARTISLDLSFLEPGIYRATVYTDGINADRLGEEYEREILDLDPAEPMEVSMAPGGGFLMIIEKP